MLLFRSFIVLLMELNCINASLPTLTINGEWSPWSKVKSDCVRLNETDQKDPRYTYPIKCGGGVRFLERSCTNPRPQGFRPKGCPGKAKKKFPCATEPCAIMWSEWSRCTTECGRGTRRATTMCAKDLTNPNDPNKPVVPVKCADDPNFDDKDFEYIESCNTWSRENCTSPCEGMYCPEFSNCIDTSTDEDAFAECVCQLGRVKNPKTKQCVYPTSPPPTKRPIPTLEVFVKEVTTIATRSASTILIAFVLTTLFLFAILRIFDVARVIQMNMEISIVCAHGCLILPSSTEAIEICRVISILIHYFFTSCFMFMFLESIHMYSLVAFVVHKDGLMTRLQNLVVGWGIPALFVSICVVFQYQEYGGEYHCWLNVDSPLFYTQVVPIVTLVILIFAVIEAAGSSDKFKQLPENNINRVEKKDARDQLTSAKIMQRSNVVIMPLVFASWMVGLYAEYEQNVALYGVFTILNGVLGGIIFVMHSSGNERVRDKLQILYKRVIKKE